MYIGEREAERVRRCVLWNSKLATIHIDVADPMLHTCVSMNMYIYIYT